MEGPFRQGAALLFAVCGGARANGPAGRPAGFGPKRAPGRTDRLLCCPAAPSAAELWPKTARLPARPWTRPASHSPGRRRLAPESGRYFASTPPVGASRPPDSLRQANLRAPESLCQRRQSARLPKGAGPRSGRLQCLGFAARIPISRACHRGSTGIAARKGHQNGFPQATVAPHEPPPTYL